MPSTAPRKKLIEVALPLDAINAAAAREKSIRHGHSSTLHLWWARRPLAAARAVIFAQMVDDPGSRPELFPTEQEQDDERQRLFELIEELVKWENTTNEELLQRANIAPVDLAQAAIGPGMAIFTRYAAVLHPAGERVTVREALAFINHALDEILTAQEGDFDTDSRWALAWFDQHGFDAGEYGSAETLATAKNTSVNGMAQAGIVQAQAGRVRLLRPRELPADWDPAADDRLTTWKVAHHLIRAVEQIGEVGTAALLRRLGGRAEGARELCYRLYTICERKQRAAEALAYNGLVQSWPELRNLAVSDELMRQTEMSLNGES